MHINLTGPLTFILHCITHWLIIKNSGEKAQSSRGRTLKLLQPQVMQFSTSEFLMHPHGSPFALWMELIQSCLILLVARILDSTVRMYARSLCHTGKDTALL